MKDNVRSPRENTEPQECLQGERKTCFHGFYYKHVFAGDNVVYCAELRAMRLIV